MRPLAIALALALATGCGTGATITTHRGTFAGTITGHTAGHVYIGGAKLKRSEVVDIDHPGNVAGILGTIVAGIGGLAAANNCSEEQRAIDPQPCQSAGLWLLTGLPIAIYGWVTHSDSVRMAGQ